MIILPYRQYLENHKFSLINKSDYFDTTVARDKINISSVQDVYTLLEEKVNKSIDYIAKKYFKLLEFVKENDEHLYLYFLSSPLEDNLFLQNDNEKYFIIKSLSDIAYLHNIVETSSMVISFIEDEGNDVLSSFKYHLNKLTEEMNQHKPLFSLLAFILEFKMDYDIIQYDLKLLENCSKNIIIEEVGEYNDRRKESFFRECKQC